MAQRHRARRRRRAAGRARRAALPTRPRCSVYIAEDPLTCVVRGAGEALEEIEMLRKVEVPMQYARPIKK